MKTVVTAIMVGLFLCGVASAGEAGEAEYLAVFMNDNKVGYAKHTRVATALRVVTTEEVVMAFNRGGTKLEITAVTEHTETPTGKPLAFKSSQNLGTMAMTVEGTITPDGWADVVIETAGQQVSQRIAWGEDVLLLEGLRLMQLQRGLTRGDRYTVKTFEGSLLQAIEMDIRVGKKRPVDVLGRVATLTRVEATLEIQQMKLVETAYVNDEGEALVVETNIAGMNVRMVACPESFALSENKTVTDFLDAMTLSSPTPLLGIREAKTVAYELAATGDGILQFPETDSQTVKKNNEQACTVTVRQPKQPKECTIGAKPDDAAAQAMLKPNRYVQSETPEIIALSRKAVGNTTDAAQAVQRIERFVGEYITAKNLSVGYASALEIAGSKEGDCTEHAVLATALCRAAGIPARVATGVVYIEQFGARRDVFVPHAWAQAYLCGQWVDVDATGGFDGGHITLATSDGRPEDFLQLLNTLGQFRITKVTVEE